jgi:hypothetical protein
MTGLTPGQEAFAKSVGTRWGFRLFRLVLLLFLLVFAVGWVVGAVFAVPLLWRHGSDPIVAVFMAG